MVKGLHEEDVSEELSQEWELIQIDFEGVTEHSIFHDVESLLCEAHVGMRTRIEK